MKKCGEKKKKKVSLFIFYDVAYLKKTFLKIIDRVINTNQVVYEVHFRLVFLTLSYTSTKCDDA